jgi:hypothetical protein
MLRPIERVVDLLDPKLNQIYNVDIEDARARVLSGNPAAVRAIDDTFWPNGTKGLRCSCRTASTRCSVR